MFTLAFNRPVHASFQGGLDSPGRFLTVSLIAGFSVAFD